MKIYTLNHQPKEALPPGLHIVSLSSIEEIYEVASAGLADLILISETEAPTLLSTVSEQQKRESILPVPPIIVLAFSPAASTETFQDMGAKAVWSLFEWEQKLLQTYGEHEENRYAVIPTYGRSKIPIVIAVGSSFKGNGCTHTAFMIAKYLEAVHGGKVAVVETVPGESTFTILYHVNQDQSTMRSEYSMMFTYENIHFVCSGLNLVQLQRMTENREYEFVILDMGVLETSEDKSLFFNADLQILLSSPTQWRVSQTIDTFQSLSNWPKDNVRLLLPMATSKEQRYVRDLMPAQVVQTLPRQADPFVLSAESEEQLAMVLSPILPRTRRQQRLLGL